MSLSSKQRDDGSSPSVCASDADEAQTEEYQSCKLGGGSAILLIGSLSQKRILYKQGDNAPLI